MKKFIVKRMGLALVSLFLLSLTGILIYLVLDFLSRRLLRHWHESAIESEEEE